MPTHAQTLAAAADGDDEALAALVRAHHARVYRFGLRVCRDGFDADDAVQEAFIKLAARPDVSRDEQAITWLFTVVKNACRRLLRPFARERRTLGERLTEDADVPADAGDPQRALEHWRLVHAVHQAVAKLDRPLREVLVLRDLEGLTGEEACDALGLTEAAMKSRLHRARNELRAGLRANGQLT